jgi:putative salt-induced outer membrane protein
MRALLVALPLLLANGEDPRIPDTIKSMLDAAIASGSEGDVAVIVKYARTADPASADLVARIASDWRQEKLAKAQAKVRDAGFFDLMKVHAELGGYRTSGNTHDVGLTASLELRREAVEWRHKVRLQTDYQESLGVKTRERYYASYEPNWKFDERAYVYGSSLYESDRFSGFTDRVSLSSGVGYSAIKSPAVRLDIEVGPAFRYTNFVDEAAQRNASARGSLDFGWKVSKGISVTQSASAYFEDANSTVASKSALLARLIGPLSAQVSYSMQYESVPVIGRKNTDTTSRASLVVDF